MVVVADFNTALAVEDHDGRGPAWVPPTQLAECVCREVSRVDRRACHGRASQSLSLELAGQRLAARHQLPGGPLDEVMKGAGLV